MFLVNINQDRNYPGASVGWDQEFDFFVGNNIHFVKEADETSFKAILSDGSEITVIRHFADWFSILFVDEPSTMVTGLVGKWYGDDDDDDEEEEEERVIMMITCGIHAFNLKPSIRDIIIRKIYR